MISETPRQAHFGIKHKFAYNLDYRDSISLWNKGEVCLLVHYKRFMFTKFRIPIRQSVACASVI